MKILLLYPDSYSIRKTITKAFNDLGHSIRNVNYYNFFSSWKNQLISKTIGLPRKLKKGYHEAYSKKINKQYIKIIESEKPDLLLVYNDQYLNVPTVQKIKKITKLAFYLGDNPFFMHNKPIDNLGIFLEADYIFSPDTYWTYYFKKTGFDNIITLYLGYDPDYNYKKQVSREELKKYRHDLVMIGRMYPFALSQWSYKRALFYNQFSKLDIKIYGHNWDPWFDLFPNIKSKVEKPDCFLSFDEVNTILNCCKIYPVDANPGLINGIHIRIFDCIGSGILPLSEYQPDLETVFSEVYLPVIKNYNDAEKTARYYLKHEEERLKIIRELKYFVDARYTPIRAVKTILDKIFN